MANRINPQSVTLQPSSLERTVDRDNPSHNRIVSQLPVAQRMVEAYLQQTYTVTLVTAQYLIDTPANPIPALADYQINHVINVYDANGKLLPFSRLNRGFESSFTEGITYDDEHIWFNQPWTTTTVVAHYLGGLPTQVYQGIERTAKMLTRRTDEPPEEDKKDIAGGQLTWSYQTQYRSGLAPDVKQMLFPLKKLGF